MIALLKAGHIASLAVWCAALLVLPILLRIYGHRDNISTQAGFTEFRILLHVGYIRIATPAAVITITLGTALIVLLQLREDWLMLKLAAVAGMVLLHAWLGHLILRTTEEKGVYQMPSITFVFPCSILLMVTVLVLVLAKPDLTPVIENLPEILQQPQDRELPPDLVPIR